MHWRREERGVETRARAFRFYSHLLRIVRCENTLTPVRTGRRGAAIRFSRAQLARARLSPRRRRRRRRNSLERHRTRAERSSTCNTRARWPPDDRVYHAAANTGFPLGKKSSGKKAVIPSSRAPRRALVLPTPRRPTDRLEPRDPGARSFPVTRFLGPRAVDRDRFARVASDVRRHVHRSASYGPGMGRLCRTWCASARAANATGNQGPAYARGAK